MRSIVIAAFLAGSAELVAAQTPEFRVVVNAENPTTQMTKAQVTELFLNRAARWPHGPEAAAVDQSARSPVREAFTRRVMGRTVDFVVNYWKQRMINEREVPPPVKGSDADVVKHVAKSKNAVGYVSPQAELSAALKVISVVD